MTKVGRGVPGLIQHGDEEILRIWFDHNGGPPSLGKALTRAPERAAGDVAAATDALSGFTPGEGWIRYRPAFHCPGTVPRVDLVLHGKTDGGDLVASSRAEQASLRFYPERDELPQRPARRKRFLLVARRVDNQPIVGQLCSALDEHADLYREWPFPMLAAAYAAVSVAVFGEAPNAIVVLHSLKRAPLVSKSTAWWFRELGKMLGTVQDRPGLVSGVPWLAKRIGGVALWMLWLQEKP